MMRTNTNVKIRGWGDCNAILLLTLAVRVHWPLLGVHSRAAAGRRLQTVLLPPLACLQS